MNDFISIIFCACCGILLLLYILNVNYFLKAWKAETNFSFEAEKVLLSTRVSIVLAVRNEAEVIENCLSCLVNQNYPKELFEIIVVNDNSSDNTAQIVQDCIQRHPQVHIRLITLPDALHNFAPKKRALKCGIDNANADFILTSDADCSMGRDWIANHVAYYQKTKAKLIVGPVKMKSTQDDSLLNTFQNYDLMSLVASGGASLYYHKPLLCNGANLSFEKAAYLNTIQDFEGKKLASGDDMFLMLAIKNKFPQSIHFLKSSQALVETWPEKNIAALLTQRKRWASKALRYNDSYILSRSLLIGLTHFALLTTGIISFLNLHFSLLFLLLFLTKFTVDFIFLKRISFFFGEKISRLKTLYLVFLYPLFILLLLVMGIRKNYIWKDRKLN